MRKSTAGVRFPGTKECIFDGCHEPCWDARGIRCALHRFACIVPGCTRTTQGSDGRSAGKECWTHHQRMWKTGSYENLCAIKDCGKPNANRSGKPRCEEHRGHLNRDGYRITSIEGKSRARHIRVMEEELGRELFGAENVHHKNGQRADNRPENLELWSTSQPSGQRVEDKIMWAKEFLSEYGYAVSETAKAVRI